MSRILRPEDISDDDLKVPTRGLYRVLLVHRRRDESTVVLDHLQSTACDEFKFSHTSSTPEAIARLKESNYDLVVLALDSPAGQELDGFESIKKAFPDMPVVLLSNTKNRDLAMAAIKGGAHDFLITNPTYPIELVKTRLLYSIERSRTEKSARSLAKTEKFILRSVVENAPLMFVRLDRAFVMRDCNKNFEEILQQPRKKMRRRKIFELIPELDCEEVERLTNGEEILRKKVTLPDRATNCPVEAYWNFFGWPFFKTNSEERESIIVAIDVTREVLLDQFREEFLAAVAHDIKNPVTGQERVLSALLSRKKDLPPDVVSSISTLRNSSLQLLNLLSTLVELYRLDSDDVEREGACACFNEVVENQLNELQCIATASGNNIALELEKELPLAEIDPTSAYRLVSNLIHNALQNASPDSEIRVKTYTDRTDVFFEVNNFGPAIDAADLDKLFQRFSRSPTGSLRTSSSGLGLYLCKQTVERYGGTIFCISDATSGTTFVTRLRVFND